MTPAEEALRDAFLAECWAPVREVPKEWRYAKRKSDRAMQRLMEEAQVAALSTERPQESTTCAHPCAQNGPENVPGEGATGATVMGESSCRHESTPGLAVRATSGSRGLAS